MLYIFSKKERKYVRVWILVEELGIHVSHTFTKTTLIITDVIVICRLYYWATAQLGDVPLVQRRNHWPVRNWRRRVSLTRCEKSHDLLLSPSQISL